MKSAHRSVDVAVLGGGPAGSATALALAHDGLSVVLVERSGYNSARVGETLPPEVRMTLRSLGLWDQFMSDAHHPSSSILYAWGQSDLHEHDSMFNPYGTGWHVDRTRFDLMLVRMAETAGANVYTGARWTSCSEGTREDWEICIAHGGERVFYRAKFLVDATGRTSALARKRGATRISYDRLVGIVVFFSTADENSLGDCTLVEAVEDGWWYAACVPGDRVVVAYMTDADLYVRSPNRSIRYWQRLFQQTTHTRALVDSSSMDSGPFVVSANSSRLRPLSHGNWLAVGDAAVAYDPLSSQGVYKALESGIRAARAIRNYFAGDCAAPRSYSAEMEEHFEHYLLMRSNYYGRETRWPHSTFWQRRGLGFC